MEISTHNALTAVSYGAVGCVGAMVAANAVLVGAGASAKVGAYVADYFKNESVAQNLRIKADQLIGLADKYAATELKLAAILAVMGGSAALAHHMMDNQIPHDNQILQNNPILGAENNKIPGENEEPYTQIYREADENAKKTEKKETYENLEMCLNQERTFITKEQEAYFRAHQVNFECGSNCLATKVDAALYERLGEFFLKAKTLLIAWGIHNLINPMKSMSSFLEPDYPRRE